MSENMQEIKRRMKSIQSTQHITNAMRLVSASKYKKAKYIFDRSNEQLGQVTEIISKILGRNRVCLANKAETSDEDQIKTAVVVISSSKGLCGGFNNAVIKTTEEELGNISKDDIEIYAVGSKAKDYFQLRGYNVAGEYCDAPEKISFADVKAISTPIIEKYEKGQVGRVLIVYTEYINSLKQEPKVRQLIPFSEGELNNDADEEKTDLDFEFEFSPSEDVVIEYMMPKYFELSLFNAVIESATCEHAARRTAMENATKNAKDILGNLSLTYNRVRQQAITNELIEIVSGSESQK